MTAIPGTIVVLLMELAAGWLGYWIGKERGIESCRTKRGIGRKI